MRGRRSSTALLRGHFLSLAPRFRETDRDRLFAALHRLSASTGFQFPALELMHFALHVAPGAGAIFAA